MWNITHKAHTWWSETISAIQLKAMSVLFNRTQTTLVELDDADVHSGLRNDWRKQWYTRHFFFSHFLKMFLLCLIRLYEIFKISVYLILKCLLFIYLVFPKLSTTFCGLHQWMECVSCDGDGLVVILSLFNDGPWGRMRTASLTFLQTPTDSVDDFWPLPTHAVTGFGLVFTVEVFTGPLGFEEQKSGQCPITKLY